VRKEKAVGMPEEQPCRLCLEVPFPVEQKAAFSSILR